MAKIRGRSQGSATEAGGGETSENRVAVKEYGYTSYTHIPPPAIPPLYDVSRRPPAARPDNMSLSAHPEKPLAYRPSHLSQIGAMRGVARGADAMEVDELGKTDNSDEEPLLLVTSDLTPQYNTQSTIMTKLPKPEVPSLTPPRKATNGARSKLAQPAQQVQPVPKPASKPAPKPAPKPPRQLVVSIPLGDKPKLEPTSTTPVVKRKPSITPVQTDVMPVSVSIPIPIISPSKGHAGSVVKPETPLHAQETVPKASFSDIGRRSNGKLDLQIKGRPKGWKPGMTYREVALRNMGIDPNDPSLPPEIHIPTQKPKSNRLLGRPRVHSSTRGSGRKRGSGLVRHPGRPPLPHVTSVQRSIFLQNNACFVPYVCEWAGCRAELHNMATLRKHVAVVHSRARVCQWRRCASKVPPVRFFDKVAKKGDADDNSRKTLLEHMEYQHLEPYEWHRGDGFANHGDVGPPALPPAAVLLNKATERNAWGKQDTVAENRNAEDGGETSGQRAEACLPLETTVIALGNIPLESLPRYLLDDHCRQVTPLLRDTLMESSPVMWTREDHKRWLKEQLRNQYRALSRRPDPRQGRLA